MLKSLTSGVAGLGSFVRVRQFLRSKYRANSGRAKPYLMPLAIMACGLATAGCSITLPVMGWASYEDEPAAARTTASISAPMAIAPQAQKAKMAAAFPRDLGEEDLRRAHGALALALDPQGNGKNVSWDNPQSGMKGLITPLGSPYLKADEICRDFVAATALQTGPLNQKGVACRPSGGDWAIKSMEAAKGEAAKGEATKSEPFKAEPAKTEPAKYGISKKS
jgi:surface antigen